MALISQVRGPISGNLGRSIKGWVMCNSTWINWIIIIDGATWRDFFFFFFAKCELQILHYALGMLYYAKFRKGGGSMLLVELHGLDIVWLTARMLNDFSLVTSLATWLCLWRWWNRTLFVPSYSWNYELVVKLSFTLVSS